MSRKLKWSVALILSVALHASAAGLLSRPEEEVQVAGGASVELAVLGNAFEDQRAAGEVADSPAAAVSAPVDRTLQPVPPEQTAIAPVQPSLAESPIAESTARLQPTEADPSVSSTPAQASSTSPPPVETQLAIPPAEAASAASKAEVAVAVSSEKAEEPEVRQAQPVAVKQIVEGEEAGEVLNELAALQDQPVPTPRPDYTPPPRIERAERQAANQPAETGRQSGSSGRQQADARRGAADGASAGQSAAKAASPAPSKEAGNAAVSNYPGKVASKLRRALRYPSEARRQRLRGEVHVAFTVSGNGNVGSVRVVRSSGAQALDQAAMEAVRRAAPFPPIPAEAGRANWPFTVPLAFTR